MDKIDKLIKNEIETRKETKESHEATFNRLFGIELSTTEARKELKGIENYLDYKMDNSDTDVNEIVDEKFEKLYKQQIKTSDKLREYKTILRDESRVENIIDEIKGEISKIKPIKFEYKEIKNSNKESIHLIGDWHVGAKIDSFFGKYDMNISKKRVEKMCNDIISYVDKFKIEILHVVNLGDMIENGAIHISTRVMQEEDSVRQIIYVSELLSTYLTKLSEVCNIEYYSTLDNHSRTNAKFTDSIAKESFVYLIDWYLQERLKDNSRINFNENMIDDSIGYFQTMGKNIMFTHGNFGKMNTSIQDLALGTGIIPDYVCMGHYHIPKMKDFHGKKLIVNGCLSGVSQYALDNRLFGLPSQTLLVFDEENEINLQIKFNK